MSTVEAEYIALSQSLRVVIPPLDLIKEMEEFFGLPSETPEVKCKLFEGNNEALELAKAPKCRRGLSILQ